MQVTLDFWPAMTSYSFEEYVADLGFLGGGEW
jgi:hypothetical protein